MYSGASAPDRDPLLTYMWARSCKAEKIKSPDKDCFHFSRDALKEGDVLEELSPPGGDSFASYCFVWFCVQCVVSLRPFNWLQRVQTPNSHCLPTSEFQEHSHICFLHSAAYYVPANFVFFVNMLVSFGPKLGGPFKSSMMILWWSPIVHHGLDSKLKLLNLFSGKNWAATIVCRIYYLTRMWLLTYVSLSESLLSLTFFFGSGRVDVILDDEISCLRDIHNQFYESGLRTLLALVA